MQQSGLATGVTVRRPRLDDDRRIFALVAAYGNAVVGFPDFTLDEVRDELNEPGFVLETDGWVAHDAAGELVGYATAFCRPGSDQVAVDVISLDVGVARWMLDTTLDRAREMGRASGHERVTVDKGTYRQDTTMRTLLADRGFEPATSFYRMRIDGPAVERDPRLPPGLDLRSAGAAESVRRDAHAVREESFVEHFGTEAQTYDDWTALLQSKARFDWDNLRVAYVDDEPVAMIHVTDQFVEDERCGYVAQIGVVERARGRGIAKALLRKAFADDAARDLDGTILHVDSNNTTPALGLYESVGMRTVLVIDVWRSEVATGGT
ncbi:GNAT family N-acetyltransferase [Solicola gregarius]|uniref:GNAT family N-acetyltransferase n=1 Tax=Solicola gregarius TaxID=2908642 RepID=A0AA46TE15_9ACTN|nr:GNAT family N-acetyltransferase [Solicola gregarius]UYM03380.1 GNAT family N-acetyltransferase [Solicola gregarius]